MQGKLIFKGQQAPAPSSKMEVEKTEEVSHLLPWVEK